MTNDWYEKGELPPRGIACQVKTDGQWLQTVVIGYWDKEVVVVYPSVASYKFFSTKLNNLRPIRAKRDALVEQGKAICKSWNDSCGKSIPELFVEANWRPVRPMTENEFISETKKYGEKFLYQAGCRFIEQGE